VDPDTIINDGEDSAQVIVTVEDDNDDVEEVWIDLTPLRGSSEAKMVYDRDNTWVLDITADTDVSPGLKGKIEVTARDRTDLTSSEDFSITIEKANSPPEILDITVSDYEVGPGDEVTIIVNVTDADFEDIIVEVDMSTFLVSDITLLDDGVEPDETAGDGTFTGIIEIPVLVTTGNHTIVINARDPRGGTTSEDIVLYVPPGSGAGTADLDFGLILYIGIPLIGLGILLLLVGIAVVRNRGSSGSPQTRGAAMRPPHGRIPPPGQPPYPHGHPLGPRAMR
jgi:hypothetical protein